MKQRFVPYLCSLAFWSFPPLLAAQNATIITTSGERSISVQPDFAVIELGITSQDTNAALAATKVARAQQRLFASLTEMGYAGDTLPTTRYSVVPQWDQEGDTIVAFEAQTSVQIVISDLARVGAVVDAAVDAGANYIPEITFDVADRAPTREEVLRMAIAEARRDAEILAQATGGRLGRLVELSTSPFPGMRAVMFGRVGYGQQAGPIAITPQSVTISAAAYMRWEVVFPEP